MVATTVHTEKKNDILKGLQQVMMRIITPIHMISKMPRPYR